MEPPLKCKLPLPGRTYPQHLTMKLYEQMKIAVK